MKRKMLIGIGLGVIWAVAVLVIGLRVTVSVGFMQPVLFGAGFLPGLILMAMIGRMAAGRFMEDELTGGEPPKPGSPAWIDARVLQNTGEQALLALLIWPLAGFALGAGVVLALGVGFAISRMLFWWGYHQGPPARAFGFAATFYPTVLAGLATLYTLVF